MSWPMPERAWTAPSRSRRTTSPRCAPGGRTRSSSRRSWWTTTARPTPLAQLASLNNPEARTLVVTPYDKSALKAIEQAIRDTPNLGANPTNDGNIVRVTLPELTEERRKEYVKIVRAQGRGRQGARAQHPPQGQGRPRRAQERGRRRRGRSRARRSSSAHASAHVDAIDDALKRKEAELLEV